MRWLVRRASAEAHPPQAVPLNVAAEDNGAAPPGTALPDAAPSDTGGLLAAAERFITQFHAENPRAGTLADRMSQVRDEVRAHGTYRHTSAELTFAARVAWRNSSRCIGRLYWRTLRVRDRRQVREPDQIAAECFTHLREAANGGRIMPMITVFAPDAPGQPGPRILNAQLVSYAGHEAGQAVIGDPAHLEITHLATKLGWQPAGTPGRFDPLPLIIESSGLPPAWFDVPRDAVFEVPLRHPDLAWFRELRLRWYAIPVISDMYL
jgi:nitric-oxide synthase, bacterial